MVTFRLTMSLLLVAISSPSIHCEEKPLLGRESHPIPFPSNRSWYVLLVAVPPKLSPERGTNRQGASSSMRWCGWRGSGRRTAVRVHTRTRLITYATESFLLLARHLVLACRSMPLLAAAAAVAANDDNDNRGIEIQTFPVMDATYTADVVVKPMYTNCSRQQQSEITTSLLFLLVVVVKQLVDPKKQSALPPPLLFTSRRRTDQENTPVSVTPYK